MDLEKPKKEISSVIKQGRIDALKMVLSSYRSNPEIGTDLLNWTLGCAVIEGAVAIVEILLKMGADPNTEAYANTRPLQLAASIWNAGSIVKLLMKFGARINLERNSISLLIAATLHDNSQMAIALIEAGEDPNVLDQESGWNALHYACEIGAFLMVRDLLVLGKANPNRLSKAGETALQIAARQGQHDIVEILCYCKASLSPEILGDRNALHWASCGNYQTIVKLLISRGIELDLTTREGFTALSLAAQAGCVKAAKLLIDQGADLEIPSCTGETPLFYSAANREVQICEMLLSAGANLEVFNKDGYTPLLWAVQQGHAEIVACLLNKHPNLDTQTRELGCSALQLAIRYQHVEIVRLLLAAGAPLETPSAAGWTPLMHAVQSGHSEITQLLLLAGAQVNATAPPLEFSALSIAAFSGNSTCAQLLLEWGANLNHKTQKGSGALHFAAIYNHLTTAKILLAAGICVDSINTRGLTPYMLAIARKHNDMSKLLLHYGANPSLKRC